MKTIIRILCVAVAFVAVDMWKAPAAFAVQQLKKITHLTKKAKKKVTRRTSVRAERLRHEALELLRTNSPTLWTLMVSDTVAVAPGEPVAELEGEDPEELAREDDLPVDIESFRQLWLAYMEGTAPDELIAAGLNKRHLAELILEWLGTPYRFGGENPNGIDCSGFVRQIFAEVGGILLPRTAAQQYILGTPVERDQLQFGDLVFFHTRRHAWVSHVGIYLGDGLFAHASSHGGVTISSLQSTYYNRRYIGARRLTARDLERLATTSLAPAPAE